MYSHQNKNQKKVKIIILLLALVFIAALGGVFLYSRTKKAVVTPISGQTQEQIKQEADTNAQTKKAFVEQQQAPTGTKDPSATPAPTTAQPSSTTVSARQESDGSVTVIAKITNVGSGTCKLDIKNGSQSVTKTADIIYQAEFSTCAGFSIAKSELGAGTWAINLSVNQSTAVTTTVEVR